jgi:hypothetical protein
VPFPNYPYTRHCARCFLLALLIATSIPIFAQPIITSVSPVAGPLGTTITINGSCFDAVAANDAVYLGPVKATILSAGAGVLTVKVPTGTAYAPLIVWADGLTSYPAAPFVLDWPGGGVIDSGYSFKAAGGPGLSTGGPDYTSNSMAVYDLDGDGYPDFVANYSTIYPPNPTYGAGGFTVWQNQGVADTLSLAPAYTYSYATGNAPHAFAIQDLDGDGKPDLAVDSNGFQTISLFLNTSSGGHISFAPQGPLPDSLLPGGADQILLLDFNGDGKPDIVVLNGDSLLVLGNTSTVGHLSFHTIFHSPTGGSAVVADFDGDGKPDLAILTGIGPTGNGNAITVYSSTNPAFTISANASSLAAGDLNGDGKPDLVTSNSSFMNPIVSVYHNITTSIGHPNFTETDYPFDFIHGTDGPVVIGDADGDGKPDVVYLGGGGDNVLVMKNTSTADSIILQPPLLFTGSAEPVQLFIGDLHGTGRNNIASLGEAAGDLTILKYVQPPPVITAFSPDTAYTGETVSIRGTHFTGATAVLLGDVPAASYSVSADSLITAVVGTGATGEVTVTTASGSDSLGGFVFVKPPPPAFRLVSFTGTLLAGQAVLQWQVTGAAGISAYIVGQATDTLQFQSIGTIDGNGADSANYSFTDTATRQGANYYRLGIIDTAANVAYSNSIGIMWPVVPTIFNVYPNPARNFLTLTLPANSSLSTVRIVDMSGAVVQQTAVAARMTQVNFDLTQMTSGMYLLEWSGAAGKQTKLILVFK